MTRTIVRAYANDSEVRSDTLQSAGSHPKSRRLPTNYELWPRYFHRWFLAMVAQALNLNRDYGNSMVPLLIGEQGYLKTQFCNHILPESMREHYMKDIKMDNAEHYIRLRKPQSRP